MTTANFVYRPTPPLPHWSGRRLLAIEICDLIPVARCAEYGNLADAYNDTVQEPGLGYGEMNAHTFGLLIDDHDERVDGRLADWTVPWHRIRDHDVLLRGMYRGKFYDLNDLGNRRWRDEDGRFVKGIGGGATPSTSPRQKIDLRRDLKRGEFERPRR